MHLAMSSKRIRIAHLTSAIVVKVESSKSSSEPRLTGQADSTNGEVVSVARIVRFVLVAAALASFALAASAGFVGPGPG